MAFFADDSSIKVQPGSELEKAIASATSVSEIQNLLHEAAVSQHLVERDPLDRDGKDWFSHHVVEPGTAPRSFAKTFVVDGKKYILECDTEAGLAHEELVLMRQLFGGANTTDAARDERGRFVAQPTQEESDAAATETARLADLQLKFQLGQLDAASYIRESGAINTYLAEQGIAVEDLKAAAQEKQEARDEKSWAQASEEFRNSPVGANWPGGLVNQKRIGEVLISMHAEQSPSVENLRAAFEYMQQNNLLVEPEELVLEKKIKEATDFESLKNAVGYRGTDGSSGLWGR